MSIPESQALKKSGTHSFALPNISRTRVKIPASYNTSLSGRKTRQHNSLFLQKIKDLTKDVQYDEMQTSNITQQQKQLKNLVRQFNQETYHILNRYIDKPSMMKTDRHNMSSSQTTEMRKSARGNSAAIKPVIIQEKQIQNSNQILQICKRQLIVLQRRCDNLKYGTSEEFSRKIEQLQEEIDQIKQVNKQITKGNTLRGLRIKKQDDSENHQISELERENYTLEKKKQRLQEDTRYIQEEEQKLKEKSTKVDLQIKNKMIDFQKISKQDKQSNEQKELKKKMEEKKKQFQFKKQKKQFIATNSKKIIQGQGVKNLKPSISNKYQFQYLKLLKELDDVIEKNKEHQEKMKYFIDKNQNCKKELLVYEHKLVVLKKIHADKVAADKLMQKIAADKNAIQNDKNQSPPKQQSKGIIGSLFS